MGDLDDVDEMLNRKPTNESECRARLDAMLKDSIRRERQWIQGNKRAYHPIQCIGWTFESHLEVEMEDKGEKVVITGDADYCIWYDEAIATSLVVVSQSLYQCLVYLGQSW